MIKERKHNIDNLFHESLGGQTIEPSEGVWASLSTKIPSGKGSGILMFLLSAIAIGAFSLFLNTDINTRSQSSDIPENVETNTTTEPFIALAGEEQAIDQTEEPSAPAKKPVVHSKPLANAASVNDRQDNKDASIERRRLDLLDYRIALIELDDPSNIYAGESRPAEDPIFDLTIKDGYVKKADILFGAGFSPAVNIYPDGQNRNDYSLELIAAYEKSRFIVEGGIGGNYATESVKYGIIYSSYDSIGYYINVNSYSFKPGNSDSVVFETSLKSVYDSIDHYRIEENTNKYAYLQIPLRIGYRIIEKNRFSLDLKVGILFSLQVYKDVPDVPYQGNDGDRIEVIRHYPDRLTTNWQYTAGVGINYHINRQLRFTLEPFYRQYLKSVYSTGSEYSARSPYAFGIRGGIYFHF